MKKKLLATLLVGIMVVFNTVPVLATEMVTDVLTADTTTVTDTAVAEGETATTEEPVEVVEPTLVMAPINKANLVEVEVIDLSLHSETSGDFTPVYQVDNPFLGKDTSKGVVIEFYAKPTWEVHELGTIFSITGIGDYDGRLYFTPGSYLGFNSGLFGGYFDANLFNYTIVTDYIRDGAKIRIEIAKDGFKVFANNTLCYDQTILADATKGAGDYKADSDFSPVLQWLAGAQTMYFGYGSWWNGVDTKANIDLSQISFRLADGTVLLDKLYADKVLIESLGGSVDSSASTDKTGIDFADVAVSIFDVNSVQYEGTSVLPVMLVAVVAVAAVALLIVLIACKKRHYDDI